LYGFKLENRLQGSWIPEILHIRKGKNHSQKNHGKLRTPPEGINGGHQEGKVDSAAAFCYRGELNPDQAGLRAEALYWGARSRLLIKKKELASGIVVTTAIFLAWGWNPVLGFLLGLFAPLAVFYFSLSNRLQGVLVLILSLIAALLALRPFGIELNLPFMFSWGATGLFLSEFVRKKYPLDRVIMYSAVAFSVMNAAFFLSYSFRFGEDPRVLIETYVQQGFQDFIALYAQSGMAADQLDTIRNQAGDITKTVYHMLPAMAVIGSIFFIWINVLAARAVCAWKKAAFPNTEDLAHWRTADKLVWFVIASGALILVPDERFKIAGFNLLSIFLFVYFFQGLSILHFFFEKKKAPYFLRGLFYIFVFAQHYLLLAVIGLGFFDLWVDFRKINREVNIPQEKGETH